MRKLGWLGGVALVLASCGGGDDTPADGGVTVDGAGGVDARAVDGGGATCGLTVGSTFAYVMATMVNGTSTVYKVSLDGELDQHLVTLRSGPGDVRASDFILSGGQAVFAASPNFYRVSWPPPAGGTTLDVGAAITMTAPPPTLLGAIAGDSHHFWAVQGSRTLVHFDLDARTWESKGGVQLPADCLGFADFIGVPAANATQLTMLATCTAAPLNRIFDVTLGTPNSATLRSSLSADEALHNVLSESGPWFGGNTLWTGGVKRRQLRYCFGTTLLDIDVRGAEAGP